MRGPDQLRVLEEHPLALLPPGAGIEGGVTSGI